jgi:hypothetical protein
MGFPWLFITAGACLVPIILTRTLEHGTGASYPTAFAATFVIEAVAWGIWAVFIYPHYVSPLRHVGQAPNSHWLFGHALKILKEPSGIPAREW